MKKIYTISTKLFATLLLVGSCAMSSFAQPVVSSVSPNTAAAGDVITITGSGFDGTATNNTVYFGGVKGTVTGGGTGSLTVTVPAGAQYASISVLNNTTMQTGMYKASFLPKYDNSCYIAPVGSTSRFASSGVTLPINSPFTANSQPRHGTIGDVDGDGKPDLVISTYGSPTMPTYAGLGAVNIYLNNSTIDGVLSFNTTPYVCTAANGGVNVKLADLDGDGKLDIVVAASGSGRISCIRNTSTGTGMAGLSFSARTDIYPGFGGVPEVAIADYDGDGKLDIASINSDSARVEIFHNEMTSIPSGAFPSSFFGVNSPVPITPFSAFSVGSLGPKTSSTSGSQPGSISTADMDGDGLFDIVVSNSVEGSVSVLRNISSSGAFNFAAHSEYSTGGGDIYTEVQIADINGDNLPDIIVGAFPSTHSLVVFKNSSVSGTLGFESIAYNVPSTGSGTYTYALTSGDFDGDGKVDIALSRTTGQVNIFRNTHTGVGGSLSLSSLTMSTSLTLSSGAGNQGITVGDMDLDGKSDFIVANTNLNSISIFENIASPDTTSISAIADSVCVGATLAMNSTLPCAGETKIWTTKFGRASIDPVTGVATGVTAGIDTVILKVMYLSDTNYVRFVVKVKALADTGNITGPTSVCTGASMTLQNLTATGGVWTSSNPGNATIDTTGGIITVTGVAAGSTIISYTNSSLSCGSQSAQHVVTVNQTLSAGTITGPNGMCAGTSVILATTSGGIGTWFNVNPTIGQISISTALQATVNGLAPGADTILYIVVNGANGCRDTASKVLGVLSTGTTAAMPITGTTNVCVGSSETLSNVYTGGTWSSNNTAVATVNSAGVVFGVSADTVRINYSVTYGACTADTSTLVHVLPLPVPGTVTGANFVYVGYTTTLATTGTVGIWSSTLPSVATVTSGGVVTGVSLGSTIISYAVTNSCGTLADTQAINVLAVPTVPTIISVTPVVGIPLATTVTIAGTGFDGTPANNVVFFGAVKGNVIASTSTTLTVTLPIGANYSSISYLNTLSLFACNQSGFFLPTYDNGCYISGTATFRPRVDLAVTSPFGTGAGAGPRHANFGDVDGDGKPDLIVCTYNSTTAGQGAVNVYRNISTSGNIAYAAPVTCTTSNGGVNVRLADLDGDGKLDIIVACSGSGVVSCLRNLSTGVGNVAFSGKRDVYPNEGAPEVAIADFNNDGKLDIAAVGKVSSQVKIFRNQMTTIPVAGFPNGFFGPDATYDSFSVGGTPGTSGSIFTADFDNDGRFDLVTSNTIDGTISVLRNITVPGSSSINFGSLAQFTAPLSPVFIEVQAADINGDNLPEIIIPDYNNNNVTVFENTTSSGVFHFAPQVYPVAVHPYSIGMGDIDGDGKVDIVVGRYQTDSLAILRNTHVGGIGSSLTSSSFTSGGDYATAAGAEPQGLSVGDIDGDKKADVVVANYVGNTVSIFKTTATPTIAAIAGATDSVCVNATITLHSPHCTTGATGFWSTTQGHASVVAGLTDTTGIITGLTAGADTVVYTVVYLSDSNTTRFPISVKALADTGNITGPSAVCVNATLTLSNTATGGVWSSSNTGVATVDAATGLVYAVSAGTTTIFYTAQSVSCGPMSASHVVTVNALPNAGTITASAAGVCVSTSLTLTTSVAGGTWVNVNPAIATLTAGSPATVTGAAVGNATILYYVTTPSCGNDTATYVVTVASPSSANTPITGTTALCLGDTSALANSSTGGTWSTSNTTVATVNAVTGVVHSVATGSDTVLYHAAYGCATIDTFVVITVGALPNAGIISSTSDSVCVGGTVTLTTTGAAGGTWHSRVGLALVNSSTGVVTGVGAGQDSIVYVSTTTSCGTDSATFGIYVNPSPVIGVSSGVAAVCAGSSTTLSATGGVTYSWSPSGTLSASTGALVTATPTAATIYTVTATNGHGCSATNTVSIGYNALPTVTAAAGTSTICAGSNTTLQGAGATTYSWTPATDISATTGSIITFTGTTTSTYTVTGTDGNGCSNTAPVTVTVNGVPTVTATVGTTPICAGTTTTLGATGAAGYSWSPSTDLSASTGATVTFSGTNTTTYTVTGTSAGCSSTATVTATVNALPAVVASSGVSAVCAGSSTTLSAIGGVTYSWTPSATLSASTGSPVTATPTAASTTYTVTGTDGNGCTNTSNVTVTVNALPAVTAAAGTSPICAGSNTTLQGAGATTYSWTPATDISATTGAIVTFTGTTTSTYTVTGTDGNGCSNTAPVTVTVNGVPTVTATVGTTPICAGTTTTLGATGAASYSWSPSTDLSASTGATVTFSGTNTTTYTVTGTSAGCSSTATVTATVNALPAVVASSGTSAVCAGSSTTLSAIGGVTYSWTPSSTLSASTGSPVTATPTAASTTYTVTGTDINGCTNTSNVTVTVNALPTVTAAAGTSPICAGSNTTLQGTGATTYSWTPATDISATTGSIVTFTGTTTSTYTVTGTDGNGCSNTAPVTVTVSGVPTVTATVGTTPICAGTTTTLGATGAATYSWSPSTDLSASTGATVTFSGTNTTTYTVTGTSAGCSSTATVTATVNPLPNVSASAGSLIICAGNNTTLSATGAATYSWTPGTDLSASTGTPVTFTGSVTSSYTVTGTAANGCTATASLTISVNPQPNAGAITGATSVCVGSSTSLANTTAGGAGTWSIANSNATITSAGVVTGVVAGTDTVFYTYTNSCGTDIDSFTITINPLAFADTIHGANDSMCIGSTMALTDPVSGGIWSSTNTTIATISATGIVTPVLAGTDTIRYIYTTGCGSDTAIYPLTIIATPTVSVISGPDSVCVNASIVLTNTTIGGVWTSSDTTIAKIDSVTGTVSGIAQGVAVIHYTYTNFCGFADTTDTIYVNPLPFADTIHGGIDSVCIGTSLTLTDPAIGGVWSTSAPSVMTVTTAGVATALSAGTAIISYAITNSCGTAYAVDTMVVNPTPVLTSPVTQTVCSGTPFAYTPSSTPAGAAYSWTRAVVPGITNAAGSDTGGINEILISTDSVAINVIYIYSLTANGCSATQNLTVKVNPLPTLTSDTAFTVCSGSPILYFAKTGVDFTVFAWTRPAVAGITPATGGGTFVINETLTNVPGVATINVDYIFTLNAAGCVNTQTVRAHVEPAPPTPPHITTMSPPFLCAGTMYQNFGAGIVPLPGTNYVWSSYNAQVWATGSTDQYCLVNFTNPGMSWVYLTSNVTGFTCTSRDSFAVIVSNDFSDHPEVWYFNTDFVCSPSDEGSYQWGYDDVSTLDSTLLSGETNQNYYNPSPDFANKYYWVITTRHGCMQKTYYKTPTGIKNVTNGGVTDMKVYPNPNNGTFSVNVTSDYTEQGVLTVTNIMGQKVMEANMVTNRKVDLQLDKAAGIYFVTVNTPHGKFTGKVTITGND